MKFLALKTIAIGRTASLSALLALVSIGPLAHQAAAQYPEKPITLITPFAAGGSSDLTARGISTLALAGDNWIRFALTERIGMTAVVLATPVIGLLLGRRMAYFRARAVEREGGSDEIPRA